MFSLVLWTTANPVTSSVVRSEKVKRNKSITLAQWGREWYEAKVILRGGEYK